MFLELPESVEGKGPTMATLVEVGQILEAAKHEPPLSFAEIGRRMQAKRVRHSTVRASVDFLARLGFVTVGSKGVQWTYTRDARFWAAARKGVWAALDARPRRRVSEGKLRAEVRKAEDAD